MSIGWSVLYFQERHEFWSVTYTQKKLFLQQSACLDSNVKSLLGREATKCDEDSLFLRTPPWRRALMEVFELFSFCSDGSCQKWFSQLILVIVCISAIIVYFLIKHTEWTVKKTQELKTSIPYLLGQSQYGKKVQ